MAAGSGQTIARLNQTQLGGPIDGSPAIIDVQFAVDALGVGAYRAQADDEFLGDLRPRKLSFEQAQHFQFSLAERLGQRRKDERFA